MKLLLLGRTGQVGRELAQALLSLGEVAAVGRAEIDLIDPVRIREAVRAAAPDIIVNAAAYTAVDRAESERELAFAVNAAAPGVLAEEARRAGALLVHYSTDYVFDGEKRSPYVVSDATDPLNVYGLSKLAGERAIRQADCRHLILRTSWIYSATGRNFALAILRKSPVEREIAVVDDQIGAPTSAGLLAVATARAIAQSTRRDDLLGTHHVCAAGQTSWAGFASSILEGVGSATRVRAIATSDYPSVARRPAYSVLDTRLFRDRFGVVLDDWRDDLARMLPALRAAVQLSDR